MMEISCSFTGHRPQRFPWRFNEDDPRCIALKSVLTEQIKALVESGATNFFSGMALGVDVWAAQIVLTLRETDPRLKLHCVLPCKDQDTKWNTAARKIYHAILERADTVQYVSQDYYNGCMLDRNRRLVDLADILLAVWDGKPAGGTAATVRYAQKQKREIIRIEPISLQITHEKPSGSNVDIALF